MLSDQQKDFLKLLDKNPALESLVSMFDLELSGGETTPFPTGSEELKFSLFWRKGDNTKNTTPLRDITFSKLTDIIKSEKLKNFPKIERPYFTPYGTFTKRNNESLVHFNKNIIALDYDNLTPEQLDYVRLYWKFQKNTLISLVSPSGNGFKVILRAKHNYTPETLYNGLKQNIGKFTLSGIEPDPMQFVLSQPFFIPYSPEPYINPFAELKDYDFTDIKTEEVQPTEIKPIDVSSLDRANKFFRNRVEYLLGLLNQQPKGSGVYQLTYSIAMSIYPYLDQQTVYTEEEITNRVGDILRSKYGNESRVKAFHRTLQKIKGTRYDLTELINQSATNKI